MNFIFVDFIADINATESLTHSEFYVCVFYFESQKKGFIHFVNESALFAH